MKKMLLVVDYQNDFVSGSLGFEGAEALEPGIFNEVEKTLADGGFVLFTRDTHDKTYLETREGKHLPVPHCVQGQTGHSLFGRLQTFEEQTVPHVHILDKPTFGSVEIGKKAEALCEGPPDSIVICGLVTDICVIANAIILHSCFPLAQIRVVESMVGSGNKVNEKAAIDVMRGMGIEVS